MYPARRYLDKLLSEEHFRSYLLATTLVAVATIARFALNDALQTHASLLIYTLPVAISAMYGGLWAALLATGLGALAGTIFFIDSALSPFTLTLLDGVRIALFVVIGIVISFLGGRLQKSQKLSRENEERFRLVAHGARDFAIFFVSTQGRIESWNQGAERIKGYTADEIIGQPISVLYTEEDRAAGRPQRFLEEAEATGHVTRQEWRVRKDGSRFWAEISLTALRDDAGKLRGFSKITRDRTSEQELLSSLEESEQIAHALLESATQAVVGVGEDGRIRLVNKTAETMFGYPRELLIGQPLEILLPEASRSRHVHQRAAYFTNSYPRPMGVGMELKGLKRDGTVFALEASLSMTDTPSGRMAVSFISDITKRKEIEDDLLRERSQLQSLLDNSPVLVSIRDLNGKVILANKILQTVSRAAVPTLVGHNVVELYPEETAEEILESDREALHAGVPIHMEQEIGHRDGTWRTYHTIKFPVSYLNTTEPFGICSFSTDITEQKRAEKQVLHAAQHDPLTGLPSRALIYEMGGHLIATEIRGQQKVAVLFFDLDRFKPINDTYGHETGDLMLKEVARRLNASVRNSDIVGRLGGDEFIALLTNVHTEQDVARAAKHLLDKLSEPYHVNNLELRTSPSIGISVYPTDGEDIDTLIRHADAAMYYAKGSGRNTYQFFTPEINTNTQRVFTLEQKLRQSIHEKDFELFYQPIIDTRTREVSGAEALIRWRQSNNELIMPAEFILAAEASGLINQLGQWALQEACRQHHAWRSQGLPPIRVAVNVSPIQFRARDFARNVADVVNASGIDPSFLELEVTESTVMKQVEEAAKTLAGLKRLGLRISLDDFGTGYSSLSYLSQFPIDKLKVDQSFIRNIDTDTRSLAIAETVIALGKKLSVEVVAEGIESEEALNLLRDRDCDLGQGYLISPPMTAGQFVHWYQQTDPRRLYH
ncbi:MAG TPA: EAL domain-containing protein [Noviherbaspirillum sp.]|nr:EAL domain-containing protein [Noviherbaspirillum sp.]